MKTICLNLGVSALFLLAAPIAWSQTATEEKPSETAPSKKVTQEKQEKQDKEAQKDEKGASFDKVHGTWVADEKKTRSYYSKLEGDNEEAMEEALAATGVGVELKFSEEGKMAVGVADNFQEAEYEVLESSRKGKVFTWEVDFQMDDENDGVLIITLQEDGSLLINPEIASDPDAAALVFVREGDDDEGEEAEEKPADDGKDKPFYGEWTADSAKTKAYLEGLDEVDEELINKAVDYCDRNIRVSFAKKGKMILSESERKMEATYEISETGESEMRPVWTFDVTMEGEESGRLKVTALEDDVLVIKPEFDKEDEPELVFVRSKGKAEAKEKVDEPASDKEKPDDKKERVEQAAKQLKGGWELDIEATEKFHKSQGDDNSEEMSQLRALSAIELEFQDDGVVVCLLASLVEEATYEITGAKKSEGKWVISSKIKLKNELTLDTSFEIRDEKSAIVTISSGGNAMPKMILKRFE